MKPKAPEWLRLAFRDGVDDQGVAAWEANDRREAYPGASQSCWLAQHDPLRRPCSGRLERAHMIPRQRVENALGALLLGAEVEEYWNDWNGEEGGAGTDRFVMPQDWREELVLLAAWDCRNAVIGCGGEHHPRFDSKQTPTLVVPRAALPGHVEEFIADYGLESEAERRFST